jgi:hypothetical protein
MLMLQLYKSNIMLQALSRVSLGWRSAGRGGGILLSSAVPAKKCHRMMGLAHLTKSYVSRSLNSNYVVLPVVSTHRLQRGTQVASYRILLLIVR